MGCEAQMGFPREGGVVLGGISVLTEGTRGPKSAGLVRRPQRGEMEWFCSKMAPPGFRAAPSPWKSLKTKKKELEAKIKEEQKEKLYKAVLQSGKTVDEIIARLYGEGEK